MSTCKRLDLQTLGSQQIMPKNLPDHSSGAQVVKDRKREVIVYECTCHPSNIKT